MTKNLLKRIITSIVLLSLLFIINFSNQLIFVLSILTLGILVCVEANNIFSKLQENKFSKKISVKRFNLKFLFLNLSTFLYIFLIFCYFSYKLHSTLGPYFFLYVVSICFFTDIGGYIFGKIIGGKKLTKVSPNKTISGTIGSFLIGIVPLFFFLKINSINIEFSLKHVLFALLVSLVSQLGDLFVSFFKRKAKIKDTGKILPGHGGFLDRVDGIIFAVPFSFFLLKIL
mgnify:CR=1 FL=1